MAPNYRSLVPGGYFSNTPPRPGHLTPGHTARYSNNPGAINASSQWVQHYPGYVYRCETTPGNFTAIFEAPEYGVAAYWMVLYHYEQKLGDPFTLHRIIFTYCGRGREHQARDYLHFVTRRTHLPETQRVDLNNDDTLLPIAKAFFRYEAGEETPLLDAQILYGFAFARQHVVNMVVASSLDAAHTTDDIPV
jgi:hypothetical protein